MHFKSLYDKHYNLVNLQAVARQHLYFLKLYIAIETFYIKRLIIFMRHQITHYSIYQIFES